MASWRAWSWGGGHLSGAWVVPVLTGIHWASERQLCPQSSLILAFRVPKWHLLLAVGTFPLHSLENSLRQASYWLEHALSLSSAYIPLHTPLSLPFTTSASFSPPLLYHFWLWEAHDLPYLLSCPGTSLNHLYPSQNKWQGLLCEAQISLLPYSPETL